MTMKLPCAGCGQTRPVHLTVMENGFARHYCQDCVEPVDYEALPEVQRQRIERAAKAMIALMPTSAAEKKAGWN